jgi:AhpD family alkylhydroperoxidase
MTGTPRLPIAELTGFRGQLIKIVARRVLGTVPESIGVMWHNPGVLMTMSGAGRKAKKWDSVDANLKSLTQMAVASYVGCTWCLDYGYFEAHNEGLDMDKAREVPRWRESDVFTPLERRVLEYAEAMCDTPPTVTDEMVAALRDDLGDAGMVELTAWIGFGNMSTRSNVALGIEAEGFAAACDLRPLAQPTERVASTVA